MVRDHQLAAAVPAPGGRPMVPALFIDDDGLPVKGLPGLLTLMHDAGFDDRECIAWIFLDAELPGPSDRRAAREPRHRGQAPRPGAGFLSCIDAGRAGRQRVRRVAAPPALRRTAHACVVETDTGPGLGQRRDRASGEVVDLRLDLGVCAASGR